MESEDTNRRTWSSQIRLPMMTRYLGLSVALYSSVAICSGNDVEQALQTRIADFLDSAPGAEHDYELGVAMVSRPAGLRTAFGMRTATGSVVPSIASGVFHVASVSKIGLALAFADLAGTGRVDLEARVSDLVPGFRFATDQQPTLRQLLEHRSGAQEALPGRMVEPPYDPLHKILDRFPNPFPVIAPPGSKPIYSNFNFLVAMTALESVVQQPFDKYMKVRFFEPWGLRCTGFRLDEMRQQLKKSNLYMVEGLRATGMDREVIPPVIGVYRSAAGMLSCPGDLAEIVERLVESGDKESPDLLNESAMRFLARDSRQSAQGKGLAVGFAPGITIRQHGDVLWSGHNGIADGFMATMQFNRELGIGYALVMNAHVTGESPGLARLGNIVADALVETVSKDQLDAYRTRIRSSESSLLQAPRPREGFYRFSNPRFRATAAFDSALNGLFVRHDPKSENWTSWSWNSGLRIYEPAGGATWREPGQSVASAIVGPNVDANADAVVTTPDRIFVAPARVFVADRSFVYVFGWVIAIVLGLIASLTHPLVFILMNRRDWQRGFVPFVALSSILSATALMTAITCLANIQSLERASDFNSVTFGFAAGTIGWSTLALTTLGGQSLLFAAHRTVAHATSLLMSWSTVPTMIWMWDSGLIGLQLWNAFRP